MSPPVWQGYVTLSTRLCIALSGFIRSDAVGTTLRLSSLQDESYINFEYIVAGRAILERLGARQHWLHNPPHVSCG